MARALHGRLGGVVLLLSSLALALAGAEALLRTLGLPGFDACWQVAEPFWQPEPDPELGWLYRPGAEVALAVVNERGMRGPVLPAARTAGRERLLFVGDSTCFGIWVALDDTFAARASSDLAVRSGRTVEYEIAALPGYSSWHARVLTRRLVERQRPDQVVFYVGAHNDHSRARYYPDGAIPARLARRHAAWHQVRLLLLLENVADQAWRHGGASSCRPTTRCGCRPTRSLRTCATCCGGRARPAPAHSCSRLPGRPGSSRITSRSRATARSCAPSPPRRASRSSISSRSSPATTRRRSTSRTASTSRAPGTRAARAIAERLASAAP